MITFYKVRWKNFLSTGNYFTEINLADHKTTILVGESGSGKSTLLDAISFALFNKPFRPINKNNLVNSINQRNCVVEIEFSVGDKHYQVRRGIKPSIFEIYCDGHMIDQDAAIKDYQVHFENQILKFNFKSFSQIIMLGASNFVPFMQLKPIDRRVIIEELLDIEIFSTMNVLLKQKISNNKLAIQENANQINLLKEKILVHESYIKQLEEDAAKKIVDNEKKIQENKSHIADLTVKKNEFVVKIKESSKQLSFEAELNEQMNKLVALESKLEDVSRRVKREIEFYTSNDTCPTCKQKIDAAFKETEIAAKQDKLKELQEGLKQLDDKMIKLRAKKGEADVIRNEINALKVEMDKCGNSIFAIEEFINKIEEEIAEQRKHNHIEHDEESVIANLHKELKEQESIKETLIDERYINDLASSLLKDSGVKSKIIKQYLPIINKYVNKFLAAMNFFVDFNIDENFEEKIKSRGRDDFMYGNFSEGERQRIDIALLFTWRTIAKLKNSVNTNLLIMDEVLDSYLDQVATENVIELLNSKVFRSTNIFVISHKGTIADKFHGVIKFQKDRGFSKKIDN